MFLQNSYQNIFDPYQKSRKFYLGINNKSKSDVWELGNHNILQVVEEYKHQNNISIII